MHFHSPTTGVQYTPAQACEGQVPFLPACRFPAAAAVALGRVHIWRALVHQPVNKEQQVGGFAPRAAGLAGLALALAFSFSHFIEIVQGG